MAKTAKKKSTTHPSVPSLLLHIYYQKHLHWVYLAGARGSPVLHSLTAIYTTRPSGQTDNKEQMSKAVPLLEKTIAMTQSI